MLNKITRNTSNNKDLTSLKIACLTVVIFDPLITYSLWLDSKEGFSFVFSSIIFVAFLCLFISTILSDFVRKNAPFFIYLSYIICTIFIITGSYFFGFPPQYSWLILVIISTAAFFTKSTFHLIIYMLAVIVSTIIVLFSLVNTGVDRVVFPLILLMFCLISYISIKARVSTQSALEKSEQKIKKMAYYDTLTGLPNRNLLNISLKNLLRDNSRKGKRLSVMFIDLDNFKNINDVFGHNFGDILLQNVSALLLSCIGTTGTVYRYGGDEFIVLLDDNLDNCASSVSTRIIASFSQPFHILNNEIYTSPSIGISVYPHHGDNVETLIKNSDTAMYHAKKHGKNNYQFFNDGLSKSLSRKIELENGLRKALQNDEFILYFQPIVELNTYKIYGFEALIRWKHPTMGTISPAEFIPLAEESGLIVPLGEWVMEKAFTQNKLWKDNGIADVTISINVSGYQLKYSNLCQTVKDKLQQAGISPDKVLIEITESVMQDSAVSSRIVKELKAMGVRVAIDDFGTGYSSIGLLKDLDIDILKIDSCFIKDIHENPHTLEILKIIINMGEKLAFDIIIEGIETESQLALLKQNDCSLGQGYLFSKPIPAGDIEILLKDSLNITV